jgi:hypothetical protein
MYRGVSELVVSLVYADDMNIVVLKVLRGLRKDYMKRGHTQFNKRIHIVLKHANMCLCCNFALMFVPLWMC